jgi:hypothetical protein
MALEFKKCTCGIGFSTAKSSHRTLCDACKALHNVYIPRPIVRKRCKQCKTYFVTTYSKKRYCTHKCKKLWDRRQYELGRRINEN